MNGTPGQFAVTDFATSRRSHTAALTDRIRREVVVQHKVFFGFIKQSVDNLCVFTGTQCGNHQCLSFASGEQCRAVSCRQNINLTLNRAYRFGVAAVNPPAGGQNFLTHNFVHQFFNHIADITVFNFIFRINCGFNFLRNLADQCSAGQLVGFLKSLGIFGLKIFFHPGIQSIKLRRKYRCFPSLFAGLFFQLVNHVNNRLEVFKTEHNRTEHNIFRQLVGLGFNHQDTFFGSGNRQFQF